MKNERIKAILTFDFEYWHSGTHRDSLKNQPEDYIEESTRPILNLLKKYNAKATFFVLGEVANKYPELIKEIHQAGHEIASHGYTHSPLEKLSEKEFESEIVLSKEILKKITGRDPIGFRAPYFSLNENTKWVLNVLEKQGFKYDSSVFPLKTPLYGIKNAPLSPYKISEKILEIPVTVLKSRLLRIPVAGGIYFRLLPNRIFFGALKSISQKRIPVLYFHPYDLCSIRQKNKAFWWLKKESWFWGITKSICIITSRLIKGSWLWGAEKGLKKIEKLLKEFEFTSIKNYFDKNL